MSGDFLDSNVILYAFDSASGNKQDASRAIVAEALASNASISFQVVQEVLNRLTRLDAYGSWPDASLVLQDVLTPLWTVMPSQALYARALGIRGRYHYAFYDSLIIAAALEAGSERLYSEDLQHGQRIEGLTIINPFA